MENIIQTLVNNYKPSEDTVKLVKETPIVLLVGVTGAGKDTIKHKLLAKGDFHHIVTHTTRLPRENNGVMEQDGVEYHFVTLSDATLMLKSKAYVEAKLVHGTIYGTSVSEIKSAHDKNMVAITDVDVQGVAELKAISDNVIAIFIVPPSYEEWQSRLLARYGYAGASPEDVDRRMRSAVAELEHALGVSYYHFIVNDDLEKTVEKANTIAHNGDTFNEKDEAARSRAASLLAEIRKNIVA
jgi:guanylate kinase